MNLQRIKQVVVCAALAALGLAGAGLFRTQPAAGQETKPGALQGAAALDQLKQDGQYESLQAAMNQARFSVSRAENTPLGRAAWHAPNRAAGYDAYVTEAGVSIAVNDKTIVSLSLHSLGYGAAMQGAAPGEVSGDKQTIKITREDGVQEWYVNGPDGLEQGFTLAEPMGARQPGAPLRLALQVSEGWRAVASDDEKSVTLRGADAAVEYSKLVVGDSAGRNIPARLTVAEGQVVIEVEDSEATYPLTIDPIFTLQQKLLAADGEAGDHFGASVALSGDTLAVGASADDIGANTYQGSVYVFTRSGGVWTLQQKLTAFDGKMFDYFGASIGLGGDTLVVGQTNYNLSETGSPGSVYVFTRSGGNWTLQQKLTAFDGAGGDNFGGAVALSGDTMVAGARGDDYGWSTDMGSAYVFTRIGGVWALQQKLTANDGAASDNFGAAVALSGNTVAVGAWRDTVGSLTRRGSAYVFTRSGAVWTQQQKIAPNDGLERQAFGYSVALDADTLAVGAYGDSNSNSNQGSAYVFTRSGAIWTQQQKITASDGAAEDGFGFAVALAGPTLAVSSYLDDIDPVSNKGSVYYFTRIVGVWGEREKLTAADGGVYDYFGGAVALSSDTLIVGAKLDDINTNTDQGSVYVFVIPSCPPITLSPASLPNGVSGVYYQQLITASGGAGPYQFALVVGALPPGLTLSSGGLISGTPTTPGTYQIILNATDSTSVCSGRGVFTITISPSCPTLTIDPPALPDGATGTAYSQTLTAVGGASPYKFTVKGKLPPGLSLSANGVLSGTPTQPGHFPFILVVSDANGCAGSRGDSITIRKEDSKIGSAPSRSSALPSLAGEEAVARLKEQGLYSSLAEAAQAARSASSSVAAQAISLPFAQLFKQTAHDGAANDSYGWSVAASDDTVVVGAYLDTAGANARQGSVYVFSRSGGDWTLQQKLVANDGAAEDRFGSSVAISGDTLVAGAPYDTTGTTYYHGSAYVFTRSNGVWSFKQKLTANDGAMYDQFGYSVGISGNTVVAGAFSDDIGTKADQGSAYVFVRSNGVWSFQQKLTDNDGQAIDQFGVSVAISGDTIIAGAPLDDLIEKDAGSAYVFVRSGTAWTQRQKLSGVNSAGSYPGDLFGVAVAISGETAIIGVPLFNSFGRVDQGLAVVYVRSSGFWIYKGYLAANDGEANDQFGSSVAINGDTALIGAHFDDIGTPAGVNPDQGSAYLFTRSGTTWAPRQRFTAQGGAAREMFGQAVALSGDRAIVGAPHARVGANLSQGAVYVFGCGYVEQPKLPSFGAVAEDGFGFAVAVAGDTAVVGAPLDDVGSRSNRGSAYVFTRNGARWARSAQLFAPDGQANDKFGYSVAISGDTIVIGAPKVTRNGALNRGSVYIFTGSGGSWALQKQLLGGGTDEHIGWSVAISGDQVFIGSPYADLGTQKDRGRVDLYNRSGATWTHQKILVANDGAASDHFGFSMALSGDRVVVGAPSREGSKGAAYVFGPWPTQSDPWVQRAKLIASDALTGDKFGHSVALSGNTALVGAPGKVNNSLRRQAAYVFVTPSPSGATWSQQARLVLGEGVSTYPVSVAVSGNTAVIGTSGEKISGSSPEGAAYVFTRSGAVWTMQHHILASDGQEADAFGVSVAIDGAAIMVGASGAGSVNQGAVYVLKNNCAAPLARLASVSAASFADDNRLAPESITALFGVNLGTETLAASSLPLPTTLAGVSLKVTDSAGVERLAPLFFVSPGQINYVVPAGTANGPVTLTVMNAGVPVASGEARIGSAAPGLFSANASGDGVAAALALRIKADGSQSYEPVAQFDPEQNRFVPTPIDLGSGADQVFLVFYGTGLRYRSSLSAVSCAIGGVDSEALFAGPAPGFVGLDQVNVRLPRSLAGRGEVDVALMVDGEAANPVRVSIR